MVEGWNFHKGHLQGPIVTHGSRRMSSLRSRADQGHKAQRVLINAGTGYSVRKTTFALCTKSGLGFGSVVANQC